MLKSEDCSKYEFDLARLIPIQTDIESRTTDTITTDSNLSNETYKFDLNGSQSHYMDLSSIKAIVGIKLVKKSDPNGTEEIDVKKLKFSLVNNMLHSLIESAKIKVSGCEFQKSDSYAERSYVENNFCFNKEAKENFLRSEGWYKDIGFDNIEYDIKPFKPAVFQPGSFPIYTSGNLTQAGVLPSFFQSEPAEDKRNPGFVSRRELLTGCILSGNLHLDFCSIN